MTEEPQPETENEIVIEPTIDEVVYEAAPPPLTYLWVESENPRSSGEYVREMTLADTEGGMAEARQFADNIAAGGRRARVRRMAWPS